MVLVVMRKDSGVAEVGREAVDWNCILVEGVFGLGCEVRRRCRLVGQE